MTLEEVKAIDREYLLPREVVAVLGRKLVLYRESEKHKKIEL